MIKRAFDFLAACVFLLLLAPLLVLVALVVRLTSPGPALYFQTRVGRHQVPFRMIKFRSMVVSADKSGFSTASGDPRITAVGRVLRKSSIDELPQLLNVIAGDMSLVGPRPYVPAQEADYAPEVWAERHSVRPGITGLAQVRVRSQGTREQVLAYDLDYVRNYRFAGDVAILLGTVRTLFSGKSN